MPVRVPVAVPVRAHARANEDAHHRLEPIVSFANDLFIDLVFIRVFICE